MKVILLKIKEALLKQIEEDVTWFLWRTLFIILMIEILILIPLKFIK